MVNGASGQTHIELLSPAGSFSCFIAAMNAGADAVYLGMDRFGARAGAENFTQGSLKEALDIAHILGKKIYLTVNTLFKDDEMNELYDFLYEPYINGLDAVIVQDIGVMSYISKQFPDIPIHVSTQAAITAAEAVSGLNSLNVKRIVPARELSLDEIRKMKDESRLEIECFIHGSMCYSYSGKCLLSSFIGGRSGNRGRCAQPCRLIYNGRYILSLRDMCTLDIIPELAGAGISSFKIEGRMKSSDYVYGVTSIYRKYLDKYENGEKYIVDDKDRDRLISYYTRSGNCEGYYHKHNDAAMITVEGGSYSTLGATDNTGQKDSRIPRIPVSIKCVIRSGKNVALTVTGGKGNITIDTDIIPEAAVRCALTKEDVAKQLKKSGGTSFEVTDISVDIDENLFIPNGSLNSIRRQGLEAFQNSITSEYARTSPEKTTVRSCDMFETSGKKQPEKPEINAAVLDMAQLKAAAKCDIDGIIISYSLFETLLKEGYDTGEKKIYIRLPYIIREENLSNSPAGIEHIVNSISDNKVIAGVYVSNLESIAILDKCRYKGSIIGDIHLYAYNGYAYDFLKESGITKTTVPVELNEKELIKRNAGQEELIIYGRLPMMLSANCIYNTEKGCKRDMSSGHRMYITDRKGEKLFADCICRECTNVIYNSSILSISDEERLFEKLLPSSVRFEFTDEEPAAISRLLKTYIEGRDIYGSTKSKLIDKYTKGHLKRGVD